MLTERYRIVGLLGKGGMGEVYRADDLKLRQPVALKFLPAALSKDPRRLERFHHEVRVARQVSHPNVCRVYDIGEADGQHFISMEYVEGEDLASVLRRMGKLSQDKALQIARQLCAGLAAAHDKGVLHRDLKPHNVMIDERGRVRVTDFGLAGFVEDFAGRDVGAGTPAYMAPEQLAGREVSVKSDVYALGLVLFELFTGQRVFEGTTREEIERLHTEQSPTSLSTVAGDIDPAVERVILRCLERAPSARPSSALAVAAALPGGDPLAAALAAGETPDPEMVAAAGEIGGMRPAVAVPCFLGVLVGIVAVALLNNSTMLFRKVSLPQPPDALAFQAREILKKLGHTASPKDRAYGFARDDDLLRYIEQNDDSPQRWEKLANNRPPAVYFWYRQSPRQLIPPDSERSVSLSQPPLTVSGMASVVLDPEGRLIQLAVVPPQRDETPAPPDALATDWAAVFDQAQLDLATFESVDPVWNSIVHCDQQAAWEGHQAGRPDVPLRVEAGGYSGRATFFRLIGPWTRAARQETRPTETLENVSSYIFFVLVVAVLAASIAFAWHNTRLRRGDRRGAFRASLVYLAGSLTVWLLTSAHVARPWAEWNRFVSGTGQVLFLAGWLWILYVAFEPYVRRRWPHVLISWTRLLTGRLRDPLVGRAILIGSLFGVAQTLVHQLYHLAPPWFDSVPPSLHPWGLDALRGSSHLAAELVRPYFMIFALWHLFLLIALRVLLRTQWIAVPVYVVVCMAISFSLPAGSYGTATVLISVLAWLLRYSLFVLVVMRFGLLSFAVMLLVDFRLWDLPITLDFSAWYATGSIVAILTLVALAAYGFHTALAGRPLLRDELLDN
jgi:serine/threonine-protein kinase